MSRSSPIPARCFDRPSLRLHPRFAASRFLNRTPIIDNRGSHKCWAASLLSLVAGGPFVPRLIDTQPPTTRQRHFGEQTPALILDRATGDAVLTHFRDKHVYVVA